MKTIKEDVIEMIENLPDEADYDEIMSKIYFRQKVDKSLKQIEDGKVIPHDEASKRIARKLPTILLSKEEEE